MEIEQARCLSVTVWCGDFPLSASRELEDDRRLVARLGDWCLQAYPQEIEEAVWDRVQSQRLHSVA
ncbi:MAG: hypothetical protein ACKV0T_03930 [Planctomycetales bacterium]